MPHSFDFDSIDTRLLTLHQVALGSKAFCARFHVDRIAEDRREYEWWEYFGHLKAVVSGTFIDTAVKIRMLQDFARHENDEIDLKSMQIEAISGLRIGFAARTLAPISLRESCNKIIHATEAKLVWRDDIANSTKFEYWTGEYQLAGTESSGTPWEVVLDAPDWCTAMIRFNRDIQDKIDWSRVTKWDE